MSSRYLIPLAVAVALATPLAAQAEQGDWLFRVGMSQVNPEKENLDLGNAFVVVDDDISPTFNISYFLSDNISTAVARPTKTPWSCRNRKPITVRTASQTRSGVLGRSA